ncbi:MAG: fluoride efflux transporter CrcB [Phycisphaerales bacterium JB038]
MSKILLIGAAGAAGTLARYGLSGFVQARFAGVFPYGTLAVNLLGCLCFGLIIALADRYTALSSEARIILLVGFMGAFTTFSTFMFETQKLLEDGEWVRLSLNLLGQNLGGLACIILGLALGRVL